MVAVNFPLNHDQLVVRLKTAVHISVSERPYYCDFFLLFLDAEQKNIIDKLANFVARNGPEFEHLTKQKQKDNPRFQFLFGGEHYNYYQYKVSTEQASKYP